MTLTFSFIERAPRDLPLWHLILGDLGNPPAKRIAKVLDVGVRTVYRWNRSGNAPRSAVLALYWLTRWGRAQVHCQAENDARFAAQHSAILQSELNRVQQRLDSVLALLPPPPGAGGSPPVSHEVAWPQLTDLPAERS